MEIVLYLFDMCAFAICVMILLWCAIEFFSFRQITKESKARNKRMRKLADKLRDRA